MRGGTIGTAMVRHGPRRPSIARGAAATALFLGLLALAGPAAAEDPSPEPTPIAFGSPQYLVFWEGHSTYDGPVVDNVYALFTELPVEPGHFVVPDGSGGVFHYSGKLIGGPYASDAELCPEMISLGIPSLQVWPPAMIGGSTIVDCARYRESSAPTPTADDGSTITAPPSAQPAGQPDPARTAAAVGGLVLAGAGAIGLLRRGPRPPTNRPTDDRPRQGEAPPDPCADQLAALRDVTIRGRMLNDLLATNRRYEALIDRQIVHLANVMIPGSFGMDVAFVLGGQWGSKLGWGFVPKELMAKALDSAVKDVVKEAAKQGLDAAGRGALDLDGFEAKLSAAGGKAAEGGSKAIVKELIKEQLMTRGYSQIAPGAAESLQQYQARMTMYTTYAKETAGPVADALGHLLSMYNAGIGVATLMEQLDILRMKRDAVLDRTAELEVALESLAENGQFARDRLDHCRKINAPGWRP